MENPLFRFSASADMNRAEDFQKNIQWILQLSKRLQNVEILNRNFRKVLQSYNTEDVFVYADCPYLGTEEYYDYVFMAQDHKDLAEMLKSHRGKFALSPKAKKELRKLYCSNNYYVLNFEDTYRLPDKRHREQLIVNFEMKHVNKYGDNDINRTDKKMEYTGSLSRIFTLLYSNRSVGQSFQTMLESHTVSAFPLIKKYSCSTELLFL